MLFKLSNSKIENRAVDVLRNVIDNHYTMDHQFNAMDKEMSWDGYIWIYKDSDKRSQKTKYDDKVPVQIKGHIDEKEVYINRNLLGGLYRENPVKSRNYEAVKSSKKWENVGNSYIIPALLLYRYFYI